MKFSNVRLLVKDYEKCFKFYTETLGLEAAFNIEGCYGSFKVAENIEGLAIFSSDLWLLWLVMEKKISRPIAEKR